MKTFNPKPGDTIVTKGKGIFICIDKKSYQSGFDFYGELKDKSSSYVFVGWRFDGSITDAWGSSFEEYQVVKVIPAQQETPVKTTTPHKHAELIKAWADGAIIQSQHYRSGEWSDCISNTPNWANECNYRIKPEAKPDYVAYGKLNMDCAHLYDTPDHSTNFKATFNGETGEPIKFELYKHEAQ